MASDDERVVLERAAHEYRETERAHERARATLVAAVVAALRAGVGPVEVTRLSTLTEAWVRRVARDHGVPPARRGRRPYKNRG